MFFIFLDTGNHELGQGVLAWSPRRVYFNILDSPTTAEVANDKGETKNGIRPATTAITMEKLQSEKKVAGKAIISLLFVLN